MKLSSLFLAIPEDYAVRPLGGLNERPKNFPSFDPAYSKVIGTQDGRDVWGSREKKGAELYGFRDGDEVVAYLVLIEEPTSENTYHFKELWVSPNQRGKGLGSALILYLTQKVGINLHLPHNEIVSPDARAVITKLASRGKIKVLSGGVQLSGDELKQVFADTSQNDIELIIKENRRAIALYGSKMYLNDGRSTLSEMCQVTQDGSFD